MSLANYEWGEVCFRVDRTLFFFFFFFSTREMEVSEKDEIERVKYRAERKMLFDKFD